MNTKKKVKQEVKQQVKEKVKQSVKQPVRGKEVQKQVRKEEEVVRFASKHQDELLRTGTGGRSGRLMRFVSLSDLPLNKNIVVKSIKGIQPPAPKAPIEHLTIAGCNCIEVLYEVYGKKKVKVLPGKDSRNVKEGKKINGEGSGRRYYDIQIVVVK